MRMVSAVTPRAVAPPLSAPSGHGATHSAAKLVGSFIVPRAASHPGLARAAAVPTGTARGVATAVPLLVGLREDRRRPPRAVLRAHEPQSGEPLEDSRPQE